MLPCGVGRADWIYKHKTKCVIIAYRVMREVQTEFTICWHPAYCDLLPPVLLPTLHPHTGAQTLIPTTHITRYSSSMWKNACNPCVMSSQVWVNFKKFSTNFNTNFNKKHIWYVWSQMSNDQTLQVRGNWTKMTHGAHKSPKSIPDWLPHGKLYTNMQICEQINRIMWLYMTQPVMRYIHVCRWAQ